MTKTTAPSLRVGALCARGAAFERLKALRLIDDLYVSTLLQETALQLVTSPAWNRHQRRLRPRLIERRDALVAALIRHFGPTSVPLVPTGGLHLWVKLPDPLSDTLFVQHAAAAQITLMPGRIWFPAEPTGEYVRLTFAGEEPEVLTQAIAKLARSAAAGINKSLQPWPDSHCSTFP